MGGWTPVDQQHVHVLHVDDDESILDLTARFLERIDDRFSVTSVIEAAAGLDVLDSSDVDCVVSDYKMPDRNGIEFLERVRADHPNLPFVLFTGEGSEAVASDAIAAGATDYVPKDSGTDQYEVLANRVSNAVEADRTERALRRTAERFQGLASAAPVPIGVVDADAQVQYVNETAVSFFEADAATDLLGVEATAVIHPADRKRAGERIDRVISEGESPEPIETRFLTMEGETKHGKVTSAPVEYDGGPAAQVVINDLTEAREARTELQRQEAFTGSLLDAIDAAFFVFESGEGLVRWNDRMCEVTGYNDEELEGMPATAFVPDEYEARTKESIERVVAGEQQRYDGAVESRDGEVIPHEFNVTSYEADGTVYRVGIAQDITERVARERQLRERKDQLETIVENFPVILFAVDEDRMLTRSTGAALSEIELEPGEAEGQSVYELFEDREDIFEHFDRAFDGESVRETVPVADRIFESFYQPVRDEDGEVTQVVGASFDVTDRIRQREELEAKNERLDAFASVVSHDLRNPLGVASGAFELVADDVDAALAAIDDDGEPSESGGVDPIDEETLTHVETVRSAHDRMDRIVDDVLALARGGVDLEERPVDGGAVATDAIGNVATDDATVTVEYEGVILADRGSMKRLVENLVRNATEHGGHEVVVGGLEDDPGFYVADDGPGIPADARESVLEAGVSTDSDGIGLGLAIVRDVADAHDWTVSVHDDPELDGARIEVCDVDAA